MQIINENPDFKAMFARVKAENKTTAEVEGVSFFKACFDNQGFTDSSFEPWRAREGEDNGRGILIGSSFLRDSIDTFGNYTDKIVFGSDAIYADIHNNGGTIKMAVTAKMKKYFWFMYHATKLPKYKYMALMKVGKEMSIKMPERKFIGNSQTLLNKLDLEFINLIKEGISSLNK